MPAGNDHPPDMERRGADEVLAVTADTVLVRHLLSVTAAVGVAVDVEPDVGFLRSRWSSAAMVLLGVDRAGAVAELGLPRRSEVYVLGTEADRDETHAWSARLGAAVLTLPDSRGDLAAAVAEVGGRRSLPSRTICLMGGSGGVGASTLAAGLALTAARSGQSALLVDADPTGGGLDLLLGAEHCEGWRWSRLASVRGHLGDLGGSLPRVEGVDVLAMDRAPGPWTALRPEQLSAVLASASRTHQLTVVDLPRALDPAAEEALRRADLTVLVAQADVRGVAAASRIAVGLQASSASLGLVVRLGRTRGLDAGTVADALRLPLLGTVEDEPSLATGAERGDPPGRAVRSPLSRTCRRLLAVDENGSAAA